jgi:hypothetical protein
MRPFATVFLAAAVQFCGVLVSGEVYAQQKQQENQEQTNKPQSQYRDQSQSLQETQQRANVQAYRGQISTKHGKYYLEEAHTRSSYLLEDTWEAKKFVNKKVRVTGWLDAEKSVLHVVSLATAP